MSKGCFICGRVRELREGACFDCVECESVIADGVDMYDNPIPQSLGGSSALNTLNYILKKYLTPPPQERKER